MKLLPTCSRGIVLVRNDGAPEMVPFQVFRLGGDTVIRIGRSVLHFDKSGRFDGTEHSFASAEDFDESTMVSLLSAEGVNMGTAPETAYYSPGCDGHDAEVGGWPQ